MLIIGEPYETRRKATNLSRDLFVVALVARLSLPIALRHLLQHLRRYQLHLDTIAAQSRGFFRKEPGDSSLQTRTRNIATCPFLVLQLAVCTSSSISDKQISAVLFARTSRHT